MHARTRRNTSNGSRSAMPYNCADNVWKQVSHVQWLPPMMNLVVSGFHIVNQRCEGSERLEEYCIKDISRRSSTPRKGGREKAEMLISVNFQKLTWLMQLHSTTNSGESLKSGQCRMFPVRSIHKTANIVWFKGSPKLLHGTNCYNGHY